MPRASIRMRGVIQRAAAGLVTCALAAAAHGGEISRATSSHRAASGLQAVDWFVIVAYAAFVLGLGWFYSRRQSDSGEYFIAAKRHMHPVLIGISLYATLLSTISYLGKPGEMINRGPVLLIGQILAVPFAYLIIGYIIIPRLMRERVTSAYELLEERLGPTVRVLGAVLFVCLRLVWMGLLIHLASVALVVIMGIDPRWTFAVAVCTGMIAIVYTSMGGLRTVVITDVLQFVLLFAGVLFSIAVVMVRMDGTSFLPTAWSPHWDVQPWFSFDPHVRVTVFGTIVSQGLWFIAVAGGDQTAVQRYMATRDATAARRSYLVNATAVVVVTAVQALLGLALLAFYTHVPGALGPGMTLQSHGDHLFPYFISHYLPAGLSGLVVAAALAAAMSSVDSGVNSITAVVVRDFLPRLRRSAADAAPPVVFIRYLTFAIGVVVILFSLFMRHVPGNFMEMTSRTANLVVVPIFTLFIFALWVPFATPLGAMLGTAYGLAAAILIAFWNTFTGGRAPSFQWVGVASLVVTLAVGLAVSKWGPRRGDRKGTLLTGAIGAGVLCAIIVLLLAQAAD